MKHTHDPKLEYSDAQHDAIVELVLREGRTYKPAALPPDLKRGRLGDCFDSALIQAVSSRDKYTYVEGIAEHPEQPGQWIVHAWLTDGEHAFDPTWYIRLGATELPLDTRYVGIPMRNRDVAEFVTTTEYKSILANGYRNQKLADKALHSLDAVRKPGAEK